MFAVVRTGGKQYRVTAGDKIVVEKLAGETGDKVDITDILLAGEGSDLKPVAGFVVGAEIIAQAKADKVTVFKKRRRHNYRRKKGHRQQHTILKIVSIGGEKAKAAKPKAEAAPAETKAAAAPAKAETTAKAEAPAKKAEPKAKTAKAPSTKDAAPAKPAAKKAPKAK
jgi:large subunit ribosomal protein L21